MPHIYLLCGSIGLRVTNISSLFFSLFPSSDITYWIKYFDKIKCYSDRPYLFFFFFSSKPETHILFWGPYRNSIYEKFIIIQSYLRVESNIHAWGRGGLSLCFSYICLFVLKCMFLSFFSSSWCWGLAALDLSIIFLAVAAVLSMKFHQLSLGVAVRAFE